MELTINLADAGPEFKAMRLRHGIKQAEVVQALGVRASNLSQFETGSRRFTPEKVLELFRSIGCEVRLMQTLIVEEPEILSPEEKAAMRRYASETCGSELRQVNNPLFSIDALRAKISCEKRQS